MKKQVKKLVLAKETVKYLLESDTLQEVQGGLMMSYVWRCVASAEPC